MWLISELYWPEETSTGHYMTGLAEGLAGFAEVNVLCAQPTYSQRGVRVERMEQRNGVGIRRVWSTRFDKDSVTGRLLNALSMSASTLLTALRVLRRGDAVLVVTNPPTLPYVVALASRLRRVPYHVILHDVYPDAAIALNWIRPNSMPTRAIRVAARWLYRGAAAVFVVGRDLADNVRESMAAPDHNQKVHVLTTWADLDLVHPSARSESAVLKRLNLTEKFVIQFAGNVGPLQDLPSILDASELVWDQPHIHLLIVGDGRQRPWLEAEIKRRDLSNITVIDAVPRDQVNDIHQACDAAIVSLVDGMLGVSVPSRIYNFMAAGRPIIAAVHEASEVGRLVAEANIGWVAGPGNSAALARAMRAAAEDPVACERMGIRARRLAEASYSRESVVAKLAVLLDLIPPSGTH